MLPFLLDGVDWDGDLDAVLAASAQVRGLCGWHIAPLVTETVILPRRTSGRYLLPSMRVMSVTAVTDVGTSVEYDWAPDGRLEVARGTVAGSSLRGLTVTLTHGYEVCPEDVRQSVLTRAAKIGADRVKSIAQGVGPYSTSTTYFDADVASELAPYRLPAIA